VTEGADCITATIFVIYVSICWVYHYRRNPESPTSYVTTASQKTKRPLSRAAFREVLARPKFKVPDAIQQSWAAFIEEVTIRIEPSTHPTFLRDPKDELFIAAALASDADYLITGGKDLLDEQPLVSPQILRPADFARLFAIA